MKISEYTNTNLISSDAVVLTDDPTYGTRTVKGSDLPYAVMNLAGATSRRTIFRGKYLGSTMVMDQKSAIQNGSFTDLWLGDYWTIGGVNWRIADFDYWYNCGDTAFNQHHLVIIPETNLGTASMNDTSSTSGGYTGSKMYTTNMQSAKSKITTAFGENVLTHREYLINQTTSGYPSAGGWNDSDIELMNEPAVFGSYIYTPANDGATLVKRYTNTQRQLALFAVAPMFINQTSTGQRISYWLRDVVSSERFARVTDYGPVTDTAASLAYGIRPFFAVG